MAEASIVFIWTGLRQVLAIDQAIFAYGGETMKVDGIFKTLTAYREEPRLKHLILGNYPELRGGKRKNYQKHRSRNRAVIYMETKGGKDQRSSSQSYQRG